jgi:hypothetical protein
VEREVGGRVLLPDVDGRSGSTACAHGDVDSRAASIKAKVKEDFFILILKLEGSVASSRGSPKCGGRMRDK